MTVKVTDDATFKSDVLQSDMPVAIDFWAEWCAPCKTYAPIFEEISNQFEGKVHFLKMNADVCPTTLSTFGISALPSTAVFKGGELVGLVPGIMQKSTLVDWLKEMIAS